MNLNNTDYWYTESDLQLLFGYSNKSNVKQLRKKVTTRKLSNRYLYLKADTYKLLDEKYQTKEEREFLRLCYAQIVNHGIDLNKWIPLPQALQAFPFSRQRLYQMKDEGKIDTKLYDGFFLFNKEQLEQVTQK